MKSIEVPFLCLTGEENSIDEISLMLDQLEKKSIDQMPWPEFNYRPDTSFVVAHSNDTVFIKYYVSENFIKADYLGTNEPVYKDSCVEFFIGFDGESRQYYNFEFNCIGTCLVGFGEGRDGRKLLPKRLIESIRRQTRIRRTGDGSLSSVYWELTIGIPLLIFCFHELNGLKGRRCYANLYKCGDDLPQPHYLSWCNIVSKEPNFHLFEFFGVMEFS